MLRSLAIVTTVWIYVQILLGAVMRHTDAGLAIPDFPLAFGHLIPPRWDPKIAIHFAHRVGALIATVAIVATAAHVFYHHRRSGQLTRPAALLLVLLALQITLGAYTVLTARHYIINSLHVLTGASVLVTSLVLALRAHRARLASLTGGMAATSFRIGRVSPQRGPLERGPARTGARA
jgi:cytochrome c oxidase assembly protein subunit 15